MKATDKAELLKTTITHLYSNEGRSFSYMSRLLNIDRQILSRKIKEWGLPKAKHHRYAKPATQKFINRYKNLIISRFNDDVLVSEVARELSVKRGFLQKTVLSVDDDIAFAEQQMTERTRIRAEKRRERLLSESSRDYDYFKFSDENWKPILGYPDYEVSDHGRVRRYAKRYNTFYLLRQQPNKNNNRLYVRLSKPIGDHSKKQNLQVARLVGHAFVENPHHYPTINHIDGNVMNNYADNLEWVTQSANNTHAYRSLNRTKNNHKRYQFKKIVYRDKYEFKTVTAFAKFLGKSETQTRRYMDFPEQHHIRFV